MVAPQRDEAAATLCAVYDLQVAPLTFDIFPFLVAAECARRDAGAGSIHFVLVPRSDGGAAGNTGISSADTFAWRQRQIVLAGTALMPSVSATSVCDSRAAADELLARHAGPRYPEYYSVGRPVAGFSIAEVEAAAFRGDEVPSLRAGQQARAYAKSWLNAFSGGKRPISITLREANNGAAKNSNLDIWGAFIGGLDRASYFPFVIRDTDRVFEPAPKALEGVALFPHAAINIELRTAIYELCHLNLIGSSGPTQLCMFNAAIPTLVFNLGAPGWSDTTPDAYRANYGIEPGTQLRHARPSQRLVWGVENLESIRRHFDLMIRFLDTGKDPLPATPESAETFAERVFTQRQWGPSKTIYRHLLSGQPKNAEWTYRLGVAEIWAGNPKRGLELLQRAQDLGCESSALYLARAEASSLLGRADQAISSARYAMELDPGSFDAALRLGVLFETSGRFGEACDWLERAVALKPESTSARAYLDLMRARVQA